MPKYQVNRDRGYPLGSDQPQYKFGETFDSASQECADDVERGYLLVCGDEPKADSKKRGKLTPAKEDDKPVVVSDTPQ